MEFALPCFLLIWGGWVGLLYQNYLYLTFIITVSETEISFVITHSLHESEA